MRQFNVKYFAASCDDEERNREFAESLELDYPILSDPTQQVARSYGVVDDQRRAPQRWTFYIGKDGRILHIDRQVRPGSHGEDIAQRLEELGVEKR